MPCFSFSQITHLIFINSKLTVPAQTHNFAGVQVPDEKFGSFFDVYG